MTERAAGRQHPTDDTIASDADRRPGHGHDEVPSAPKIGARLAVRNAYTGTFAPGFVVAAVEPEGVRVKRVRDGHVLPALFDRSDIDFLADGPGPAPDGPGPGRRSP